MNPRDLEDARPRLLLVDDEPVNLQVLRQILQTDYRLQFARDGARAVRLARESVPSLILLDVMMPDMSGIDVCRALKGHPATSAIPVIFVSALSDEGDEMAGLDAGSVDYVTKPVSAPIVRARVRNHLSLVRVDEIKRTWLELLQRLGRAAEFKDNETGRHIQRMGQYSRALALACGFDAERADDLLHAAAMHDIGKVGVPDAILMKPGPLDADERAIMRRHPEMGADILGDSDSSLLKLARSVALTHHEKWDGSGYPAGLSGEAIPIEGRIVAIADIFDALTSERPYKRAWTVDAALDHLREQAGRTLDAVLVARFIRCLPEILEIRARWAD